MLLKVNGGEIKCNLSPLPPIPLYLCLLPSVPLPAADTQKHPVAAATEQRSR